MQENQKVTSNNKAVVNELKGTDPIYINKKKQKTTNFGLNQKEEIRRLQETEEDIRTANGQN